MSDPRDSALLAARPVVAIPHYGELAAMDAGQRVLMGADGVFLQVRRRWLDCVCRVGSIAAGLPLPYGRVEERIDMPSGAMPLALLDKFVDLARAVLPYESAAALTLAPDGTYRLHQAETLSASRDHIQYRMPTLDPGEELVLDLHSHGADAAFFSACDDRDDRCVKLAAVVGHLDRARPSAVMRLVLNGWYRELPTPWF